MPMPYNGPQIESRYSLSTPIRAEAPAKLGVLGRVRNWVRNSAIAAAGIGTAAWILSVGMNLTLTPENMFGNGKDLPAPYELKSTDRQKWKSKIVSHLRKSGDFGAIAKQEGVSVDARANEWADTIIDSMEAAGIPMTEEKLKYALILLHRESRLRENPPINMTGAYGRIQVEIDKRLDKIAPEKGDLRDFLQKNVDFFEDKYGERIKNAKTEKELDEVMAELRFGVEELLTVTATLIPEEHMQKLWREFQNRAKVKTFGALQVGTRAVQHYYEARGEWWVTEAEARERALTLRPNLEVGFTLFNQALEAYRGDPNQVECAFADYNAGLYSSRNVGVQMMAAELSGHDLVLDGDLLIYEAGRVAQVTSNSKRAIWNIPGLKGNDHPTNPDHYFPDDGWRGSYIKVSRDLRFEKTKKFEQTRLYKYLEWKYQRVTDENIPTCTIPTASDPRARIKYGKDFNTAGYVRDSMRHVRNFSW